MFFFLPTRLSVLMLHCCPPFVFSSDACTTCVTLSLSLSLTSHLILTLSIYIPSSSSHPLSPPLFSWLLNQCLKCVSKVSLAQHLSTATYYLLFQEICMCGHLCVSLSSHSAHTNTHPSICPISTCAEAQPPGKLTNESLPQPSVSFLAAFSFNSSLPSIPPSLTCLPMPLSVMQHWSVSS